MNLPEKKYNIIYADPPWSYDDKALAGNRGACCKYPVQNKEWIDNLPVSKITDDNCVLFLWVTMPKLNECWELISNWGFKYKTVAFTWIKTNKNHAVKQQTFIPEDCLDNKMGMGRWTRSNAELCLLALKGKIKRQSASVRQIIYSPIQEHSKKPSETRDKIIELVGDLPRIELFARQKIEGWDVWGNEI